MWNEVLNLVNLKGHHLGQQEGRQIEMEWEDILVLVK
jgi:hypothetical protein